MKYDTETAALITTTKNNSKLDKSVEIKDARPFSIESMSAYFNLMNNPDLFVYDTHKLNSMHHLKCEQQLSNDIETLNLCSFALQLMPII